MTALIRSLDDVRGDDVASVGGKAAALGALRAAGFPVPPAVCVTTAAFEQALGPYRQRITAILTDPARIPAAAKRRLAAIAGKYIS